MAGTAGMAAIGAAAAVAAPEAKGRAMEDDTPVRLQPHGENTRDMRTIDDASLSAVVLFRHSSTIHLTIQAMMNTKAVTWSLALFTSVSFVLCVIYGLVTPESIHMHRFLEIVLPAFKWISVGSFFLGLAESFLWGAYVGLVFSPIYNAVSRRQSLPKGP
jgi:hypothetical protein